MVNIRRISITGVICFLWLLTLAGPAAADTNYWVNTPPTVIDGGFQQINGQLTIEGTTKITFTGDSTKDR